ncbi:alpha/beta hydrolase-fold protein [Pelosinus sp. UFO1]|uniref:alpha/beta hydrolase-fold protein n=1 Tax=Pelosinus sp. UFO1 TaxID=484770 RepID=UPI0004D1CB80|nr:alpha/beta hydrolase-fold protein [Pelosinus sp. UFO1]AIF49854.1 esterase [Pelosinus sp. UFO1]
MKRIVSTLIAFLMLVMTMNSLTFAAEGVDVQITDALGNKQMTIENMKHKHIKSVTAINEVFGDGQKVSAVAVEYDSAIDTSKLKASDFTVEDKNVTKVYANTAAEKAYKGVNGQYVIVELDTTITPDTGYGGGNGASNDANGAGNGQNGNAEQGASQGGNRPPGNGGPTLGFVATDSAESKPLTVNVTQSGDIATVGGQTYKADSKVMTNSKDINLVVDDFKKLVYTDPNYNNEKLMYNLYVPKNYDPSKKYPLVLFMHDAGVVSNNPTNTLTQGLGAVVWAEPSEQAKNECFVLAPQYTSIIADDTSQTTEQMDITVDLVKDLEKQYSIDSNRLYNTGQSMGGMTSIAMEIKYPDMFAASLLVACQWDVNKVTPMVKKNLWIVVSEGDNKANPGMDSITEALKKQGATVSKATWSAESSAAEFATDVSNMLAAGSNIYYTVFKNGNHRYTWQYAYTIEGVRDWLFKQVKQ